jgi:hypothetical protein
MHLDRSAGKNQLLRSIARIGSLTYQQKACLRGTPHEYVLLDELIETTISRATLEVTNDVLLMKWSLAERNALREFADRVEPLLDQIAWQDKGVPLENIVNEDQSMRKIRDAANECLSQVGTSFSLEQLLAD